MKTQMLATMLHDVAAEMETVDFYNGYSGRGMFGYKCVGLTGPMEDCLRAVGEVLKQVHAMARIGGGEEPNPVCFDDAVDVLLSFERDSMGMDVIIYWTTIDPLEETEE